MKKILFLLPILVSGCTTYSNKFDCPYGQGLGCASVTKVNRMIDSGVVDLDEHPKKSKKVYVYFGENKMSKIIDLPELSKIEG